LPLAFIVILSVPFVTRLKVSDPVPYIPVFVSEEKLKAGEDTEPLAACTSLPDVSMVVLPICTLPDTKLKLSPDAKERVSVLERYSSTSVPKPIPPEAVV